MAEDIVIEDCSAGWDEVPASACPPAPGAAASQRAEQPFLMHAIIYGLGALALQAASVILVPLYTRCLTPAEFGVLEMLNRIGEVFYMCLIANGIRLAAFTFYCQAKTELERKRNAASVLVAPMIVLCVAGVAAAIAAPLLDLLTGIDDPTIVVFAVVVALLEGITVVPMALIQARVDSAYYVAVMAAMFCFRVALSIVVVACLGWGVWGILAASATTSVVFGVLLSWRELRKASFRPDVKRLWEIFRFALPFVPVGLCGMALHNGDRFFLMTYSGADELGQYALGYKVALVVGMISTGPLCQVWTARMFDAFELPGASVIVGRVCTRILAAYVFVGIGVCLFQEEVIRLLAVPSYHGATAIIAPVTLAYFFWALSNLMDAPLWVRRRSDLKPWIIFASSSATLGLYAWLIPRHGAAGAAYATLFGLAVHCAITCLVSQRVFRVHYEFGRLAVMLALGSALVLAARGAPPGFVGLVEKALLWATWPAVLWWGGIVAAEEKLLVVRSLGRVRRYLGRIVPVLDAR